jgi:hypothetical protein
VTSSDNVCRLKIYTLVCRNKFQARLGLRDRREIFLWYKLIGAATKKALFAATTRKRSKVV